MDIRHDIKALSNQRKETIFSHSRIMPENPFITMEELIEFDELLKAEDGRKENLVIFLIKNKKIKYRNFYFI